jgi:hypothetical protein
VPHTQIFAPHVDKFIRLAIFLALASGECQKTAFQVFERGLDGFSAAHSREGEDEFYQIEFLQSKHPEIFGEI